MQYGQNKECIIYIFIVDQPELGGVSIATLQDLNTRFHTPFGKVVHEYSMIVGI